MNSNYRNMIKGNFLNFLYSITLLCFNTIVYAESTLTKYNDNDIKVKIDGVLSEEVWNRAFTYSEFKVINPSTNAVPEYKTLVKLFYTDKGIYLSAWNEVPIGEQVVRVTERDRNIMRDEFNFAIDTSGKGLYGYLFDIHLGGSVGDAMILPEKDIAYNWNGIWYSATKQYNDAWVAEAFIPWSNFSLPDVGNERTMNIFFGRRLGDKIQKIGWPAIPASSSRFISLFKPFTFSGIKPKSSINISPNVSFKFDNITNRSTVDLSADLFWRPSPNSQLNFTLNPSFEDTVVDDLIVNLTAYETYLEEKRPFFIEGMEIFNTGLVELFNTRRIGSEADIFDNHSDNYIVSQPNEVNLDAAGKATWQKGNWRIGYLTAFEDTSEYSITDSNNNSIKVSAKGRDFNIGRLMYESKNENAFWGIGLMSTYTSQNGWHLDHEDTYIEGWNSSSNSFDINYKNSQFDIKTQIIQSKVANLKGNGSWATVDYSPNSSELHTTSLEYYDRSLDISDLGYLRRNDLIKFKYQAVYRTDNDPTIKNSKSKLYLTYGKNLDGYLVDFSIGAQKRWRLLNQTEIYAKFKYYPRQWEDRNNYGFDLFKKDNNFEALLEWESDESKHIWFKPSIRIEQEIKGGISSQLGATIRYNPTNSSNILFNLNYKKISNWILHDNENTYLGYYGEQWNPNIQFNWIFESKHQINFIFQYLGIKAISQNNYDVSLDGNLISSDSNNFDKPLVISDSIFQFKYRYEISPLAYLNFTYTRGSSHDEYTYRAFKDLFRNSLSEPISENVALKIRYIF